MYSKFKVGESEACPCNVDIMAAEHLLRHCQLHDVVRRDMWPEPTPLRDKVYGVLEELRRTAAFDNDGHLRLVYDEDLPPVCDFLLVDVLPLAHILCFFKSAYFMCM